MRVLRAIKERLSGFGADAYRWTIITSAPKGEAGERWGDTWFARDVAAALRRQGQQVSVVPRSGANQPPRSHDDVVVVLRGLKGVDPPPKRTGVWILWVISHPELVTEAEARAYDMVFVASKTWSPPGGVPSTPLLQATASDRFSPDAALPDSGAALLFVGSTRGQFRPAVRGALTSDRADELSVYGVGWEEFIEVDRISGEFLDNDQLPAAYAGARPTEIANAGRYQLKTATVLHTGKAKRGELVPGKVVTFAFDSETGGIRELPPIEDNDEVLDIGQQVRDYPEYQIVPNATGGCYVFDAGSAKTWFINENGRAQVVLAKQGLYYSLGDQTVKE